MAVGHISFSRGSSHGANLRAALDKFADGFQELQDLLATMILMQDGGVSTSYIVGQFGFEDTAGATNAVNELGAMLGKLTVDSSVSNVYAAIAQCLSKFR